MHDLDTLKRLNDTKVDGILVRQARGRSVRPGVPAVTVIEFPQPDRHGWVPYPHALRPAGTFVEDLPLIVKLVGSTEYEYKIVNTVYIRRARD